MEIKKTQSSSEGNSTNTTNVRAEPAYPQATVQNTSTTILIPSLFHLPVRLLWYKGIQK